MLLKGDCLVEMDKIPDGSVDLILTDPPYGTTACKWDSVIPFEPMWEQLNRIIKTNGAIVLFGSEPFSSALRMSNTKNYKYDWVWEKESARNFVLARYQPLRIHENIIIFGEFKTSYTKKHKKNYNPQMTKGKPYTCIAGKEKFNLLNKSNVTEKGYETVNNGTRFPKSIIKFNRDKNKQHPTQKPVALMEYLIKTYTNEGETILDFTMGSGTTGVACVNTNRKFIGIEMDDKYFEIAKKRINDAQEQMTLSFI